MATSNYSYDKYSYAARGWDVGMNRTLQHVNDTAGELNEASAEISSNISAISAQIGLTSESVYPPIGYNLGFDFWQRGTGFTGSTNAATADLWWKNGSADVSRVSAPASFNTDYAAQLSKKAGSTARAVLFNSMPFPSKLHHQIRFYRNRGVTAACDVVCSTASEARIGIFDGVSWTYSSYHTGGGSRERLVVNKTISLYATTLLFAALVDGSGTGISAQFGNVALVRGTLSTLPYLPRHPQEDELACRMMYQEVPFGIGWGNLPTSHVEQLSILHSVPMLTTPDAVTLQQGVTSGGTVALSVSTVGPFLSTVRATGSGRTTTSPYNVSVVSNTLKLEVYHAAVGGRCLGAQYSVS